MKTTGNSNSGEGNRRVFNAVNHDRIRDAERKEGDSRWRDDKEEKWNNTMSKENSFGTGREFGMALENKMRHENESKSVHVEDWENDPYSYHQNEEDVRGELDIRKENTGRNNNSRENEYRKSGKDETLGVP